MEKENLISKNMRAGIIDALKEKGVEVSDEVSDEKILDNLKFLAVEGEDEFGESNEKAMYLPLAVKKAVFHWLYPNGGYSFNVKREGGNIIVTVEVFANTTDTIPIAHNERWYLPPTPEDNVTLDVSMKVGATLTRALADIGIGLREFRYISGDILYSANKVNSVTPPKKINDVPTLSLSDLK